MRLSMGKLMVVAPGPGALDSRRRRGPAAGKGGQRRGNEPEVEPDREKYKENEEITVKLMEGSPRSEKMHGGQNLRRSRHGRR
jgi:hypothetical protein